jgi:hypothetical protein
MELTPDPQCPTERTIVAFANYTELYAASPNRLGFLTRQLLASAGWARPIEYPYEQNISNDALSIQAQRMLLYQSSRSHTAQWATVNGLRIQLRDHLLQVGQASWPDYDR